MILFTCKYITTHLKQLVLVTAPSQFLKLAIIKISQYFMIFKEPCGYFNTDH